MSGCCGRYGNTAAAAGEGRVNHDRHVIRHRDHRVPRNSMNAFTWGKGERLVPPYARRSVYLYLSLNE